MLIGVLRESKEFEKRVALTPDIVKLLIKKGFQVLIETGAGLSSAFSDLNYKEAGAKIVEAREIYEVKILVKVNPFTIQEVNQMKSETVCISFLYAYTQALITFTNTDKLVLLSAKKPYGLNVLAF